MSSPALAVRSGLDPAMVKSIGSLVATSMEGERQRQIASELVRCATVTEVVQRLGVKRREVYAVQQELEPNLIAAFEAARGQKKIS
ncbi:MAG TPA: hypothetical protein VMF91_02435 [Bryobacteraceae bacterium]|nr:hypothetical protein [Bryobacteraceae bacterium]